MSGNLVQAMGDAISLVEAQARIRATIWQALLYPSALSAMMVFLLCIVAYRMVPSLARLSDPVTWTGPLATLNAIASFVTGPGIYVLVAVITLTVVVIVTLPTYRWKGRVWLDRMLPPWSIYRMLQGTTFLLNMAVMLNAGIRPYDSLASMIKISPPWLKQRLEAARYGVGLGQNLGVALRSAGHDFPDRQAIQYLCILANREASPKRWSSSAAAGRRPASSRSSWPPAGEELRPDLHRRADDPGPARRLPGTAAHPIHEPLKPHQGALHEHYATHFPSDAGRFRFHRDDHRADHHRHRSRPGLAAAAGMFSSSNANEEQRNISVIAANARALKTSSGYGSSGTNLIPSLIAINGVPKNMSVSSGVVYNVYGGSVTVSSTAWASRSPPASCPRTPVSRWPPRSRRTHSSRPRSTADPRSLVK